MVKQVLRVILSLLFIVAGVNHFLAVGFYVRMMPSYLPWHIGLVYLSGVAEIALGALLLIPRTSALAAWGLIALMVSVFPANLQMALHPETFAEFPQAVLWLRLPLQAVLIAWAYWYTQPADGDNSLPPTDSRIS